MLTMLTTQRCRGMCLATALILGPVGGLAQPLSLTPEGPPPAIRPASGHPDEPALAPETNPLVTRSLTQGWAIGTPRPCSALQAARPLSNPVLKTIAEGIPHKCDDQLWGRWLCGELYDKDDGSPAGYGWYVTLSSSITPEGFERVRMQSPARGFGSKLDVSYTVDRQWHPDPNSRFKRIGGGSMLKRATCDLVSPYGGNYLTLSHKRADGTKEGGGWVEYYRGDNPNIMHIQGFKYIPETKSGEPLHKPMFCERQSP